jgi:DNA repair protein RecO (recombination protein O)
MKRVHHEPAYVLHRYPFSETSSVVELYTRHHGRVTVMAKGAKRPNSSLRAILLPLQSLHVSYSSQASQTQVHTLRSADWQGGHVMPTGQNLLCGYYLNELLMRLLAKDDPNEVVFDVYDHTVKSLCTTASSAWQGALRAFELLLLKHIGVLPGLTTHDMSLTGLEPQTTYVLRHDRGLMPPQPQEAHHALAGQDWEILHRIMEQAHRTWDGWLAFVHACTQWQVQLKPQLRYLLSHHCGIACLKTRQLMLDLQAF